MNLKKTIILSSFAIALMAATGIVFAEDAAVAPTDATMITSSQPASAQKGADMQWAWGEVTNLDNQANTITLKYLDYETDQEKDLVLTVDEKTTFENIKGFNDLKLKDTLSIDYLVGTDNKNIAKNVSFEKPSDSSSVPVLPETASPNLAQPAAQSEVPPVDSTVPVNETLAPAVPVTPVTPVMPAAAPTELVPTSQPPVDTATPSAPVEPETTPVVQNQAQ